MCLFNIVVESKIWTVELLWHTIFYIFLTILMVVIQWIEVNMILCFAFDAQNLKLSKLS